MTSFGSRLVAQIVDDGTGAGAGAGAGAGVVEDLLGWAFLFGYAGLYFQRHRFVLRTVGNVGVAWDKGLFDDENNNSSDIF